MSSFDTFVSWVDHRPEWAHLGPVLRTAKGRAAFDVITGKPAGVRLPKNRTAVREFLALESAGQLDTDLWKRLDLPFEGFLRFGQLPPSVADANMKALQRKFREALGESDTSSAPAPVSAGLRIVKNGKVLLVHPTNAPWKASYSIPKGLAEPGEEMLAVALREVEEEIGVDFSATFEGRPIPEPEKVENRDASGKLLKTVLYWTVDGSRLPDVIPQRRLQLEEVDWAGFVDPAEAEERISPYQHPLLTLPGEDFWEPTASDVGLTGGLTPGLDAADRRRIERSGVNLATDAIKIVEIDPT